MIIRMQQLGIAFSLWGLCALAQAATVPEVTIRHISSGYGQGQCVERFGIGSVKGEGDVGELVVSLRFLGKDGTRLHEDRITVSLTDSTAGRYVEEVVSSEKLCAAVAAVVVTKAMVQAEGRSVDLVKQKRIREERFMPYKIRIGR
jgi:interleukin receptor mimic A-like protein